MNRMQMRIFLIVGLIVLSMSFSFISCTPPIHTGGSGNGADGPYDLTTLEGFQGAIEDDEYMQSLEPTFAEAGAAEDFMYGDVNGDGVVDITDAFLTARFFVGYADEGFIHADAADVNDDGLIDIVDALLIARYYVDLIDSFPAESNLFLNGHFHAGDKYWEYFEQEGGSGSMEVVNGELKVAVDNGGSYLWSIGVAQLEFNLQAGNSYTFTYRARTNSPGQTELRAVFQLQEEPWTGYADKTFSITNEMSTYSLVFTMQNTDSQAVFNFHMGTNNPADIFIDDVGLYISESPSDEWPEYPGTPAGPASFIQVDGRRFKTPNGAPFNIKGIAFGNDVWAETNSQPNPFHHNALDFIRIREMGFNAVRFYLHYNWFEDDDNPYVYKESAFEWLDNNIAAARLNGIYLILNMHAPQGGYQSGGEGDALWTDRDNQLRLMALWKEIARRYKDEEHIIGYGLVNEPRPVGGIEPWTNLAQELINAMREVDTSHIFFIEPAWPKSYEPTAEEEENLRYPIGLTDPGPQANIAYEFHFYLPYQFVFQTLMEVFPGPVIYPLEGWYPNENDPDREWVEWNKDYLIARIDRYLQFSNSKNIPLYLGEFGVPYFTIEQGGAIWVGDMLDILITNNISYNYHDYHEYLFCLYHTNGGAQEITELPNPDLAIIELINVLKQYQL